MKREDRIRKYERMLDRANAAARQMEDAQRAYDAAQSDIKALEEYYTSRLWLRDYDADAAGLLPPDLKRGVLSQDGIEEVLDRFAALRRVRTSAKALVIREGKLLAIRLRDRDGDFYIMPGGGQNAGELLPDAAEREVLEETGIAVAAKEAVFLIEGAKGETDHRVDLVFRCEYLGESGETSRPDKTQVGYEWLEIARLNLLPLYPSKLRRPIMNYFAGLPTPFYLGNENVGDPEITE